MTTQQTYRLIVYFPNMTSQKTTTTGATLGNKKLIKN